MTRIQERRLVDSFKKWKSEENWWSKVLRGKHMGSIAQVVKWVMWIYGSGAQVWPLEIIVYRNGQDYTEKMCKVKKKKQRKMTEFSDNPNSSGSHILTQIEKFFFLSYFSFFLIQKGTDWYLNILSSTCVLFTQLEI